MKWRTPLDGILTIVAIVAGMVLPQACRAADSQEPLRLRARVLATYAHDPLAYTQGLLWHGGYLFESTGR